MDPVPVSGARPALGLPARHPAGRVAARRPRRPAVRGRRPHPGRAPNRHQGQLPLRDHLSGRDSGAQAPLPPDRVRSRQALAGGLHARAALPWVRGPAAAPGSAGRRSGRPQHRPGHCHVRGGSDGVRPPRGRRERRRLGPSGGADRQGDRRPPGVHGERRAVVPEPGPPRVHTVGRRGAAHSPGHADRLGARRSALRAGRADHRPAPAGQRPPAAHAVPPSRSRQHPAGGGTRRADAAQRRLSGRSRPRRGRIRRPGGGVRGAARGAGARPVRDRTLPRGAGGDSHAAATAAADRQRDPARRSGQQPARPGRAASAGNADGGDRRVRLGQVDAGVPTFWGPHCGRPWTTGGCRRDSAASKAASTSTRSSRSTRRRSAAHRGPIRPRTSGSSRRSGSCSPPCRKRVRSATGRAGSPSTSPAAAARTAPATARSRSRCTFFPTCS